MWALLLLLAADPVVLHDDGGWCWFEDERVVVVNGKLVFGTVASGWRDANRKGNVEAVSYDLKTGQRTVAVLHAPSAPQDRKRWHDDHNSPAFAVRGDGRLLALYALHGVDEKIHYRVTERPGDASAWREGRVFVPSAKSRVTYSNLHRLTAEKGRIYDFYRGFDNSFKPSVAWSDDDGETWTAGNVFINVPAEFRHRPYVKYASNGRDTVHIAYTEGHPRDYDNSIYHVFYRNGQLHRSDGTPIRSLQEGLARPEEGTRVFAGDKQNVAWIHDVHLDAKGNPYLAYSVQKDSGGMPPGVGGDDFRYRYARFDGKQWHDAEMAFGGSKLYAKEDDYTGLIALDPHDPSVVYISTNADPATGKPLVSAADGKRHWEIHRGVTKDGKQWQWTAVTKDSKQDQLRPIIPIWPGNQRAVLWLRGVMRSYTDYDFEVVGQIEKRR
ncbi:MAG: BNR repeat-containing protein [Bryobacter sp.]|nr:BNR repeat-containing protein [Bryobacter sp.]